MEICVAKAVEQGSCILYFVFVFLCFFLFWSSEESSKYLLNLFRIKATSRGLLTE